MPAAPSAAPATRPPTGDSNTDSAWIDRNSTPAPQRRWPLDSRLALLVLLGLAGAALLVLWWRLLAAQPFVDATLRRAPEGEVLLQASTAPSLLPLVGRVLVAVGAPGQPLLPADALLQPRSARWVVGGEQRQQLAAQQAQLAQLMRQPVLTLAFDDGLQVRVATAPRGLTNLGLPAWGLGALALALCCAAAVLLLDRPGLAAAAYAVMALAEAGQLLLIGAESLPGLGCAVLGLGADLAARAVGDALGTAALVQIVLLYPRRLALAHQASGPLWLLLGLLTAALLLWQPAGLWWALQLLQLGGGVLAWGVLRLTQRQQPSPLNRLVARLTAAGTATLALLTLAVALAQQTGPSITQHQVAAIGSALWQVFLTSLLLLAPFLGRSRSLSREFAVLAGSGTVACSLDLMFITLMGVGQAAAITLALAVTALLYLGARQWARAQLAGASGLSAERMFDGLYRAARALEQRPERAGEQLSLLLREVFDPLELSRGPRPASRIRVAADGSALVVPVPQLGSEPGPASTVVLRFAHRGRRLFTHEDQQFTERLIEQLCRAAAYDRAVEQGRNEERTRIAQDLHDDIGARLLTLMYKAPDPEIEAYIRHTLQDLKTLTRGLATGNQRLSHAAAEWKSDITQRLAATGCDLRWSFSCDSDLMLTVVQWSGLTRVLRELVNNIIAHAQATQVEVLLQVDKQRLLLVVSDDGVGRAPERWSHGLGLGGVRKRVKLLGGQVAWRERSPQGIRCEVQALLGDEV